MGETNVGASINMGLTLKEKFELKFVKAAEYIGWVDESDLPRLQSYYELMEKRRVSGNNKDESEAMQS